MNAEQFAPRELCERLQKLGCMTESGFYWQKGWEGQRDLLVYRNPDCSLCTFEPFQDKFVPAFFQNDFTGATEQADDNLKKALSIRTEVTIEENKPLLDTIRSQVVIQAKHILIDCHKKGFVWWQYLERTMKT